MTAKEKKRLDSVEERGVPSLLVVDDEAPVRRFLRVILERLDYKVDTATGGADALAKIALKNYDVVLTDLIMPRVDGLEVIRGVKEISPETEVVMITGYPSSETIVAATRAGALDYLPKSPDPEHLQVMVEKAMQIRALRRKASERDYYLRMAQMDGLTELFNQPTFLRSLAREHSRAQRLSRPLSLLFADVNGLAVHNERRGRLFGDRVLRSVAGALRANCRTYDIVARYGPDEFAVLAPETASEGGVNLCRRIAEAVHEIRDEGEQRLNISLSIGLAAYPEHAEDSDTLVTRAEAALKTAREQKEGIHVYE